MANSPAGKRVLPGFENRQQIRYQGRRQSSDLWHQPIEKANPGERLGHRQELRVFRTLLRFEVGGPLLVEKQGVWQHLNGAHRAQKLAQALTAVFEQVFRQVLKE